jgi:hypothetical protein
MASRRTAVIALLTATACGVTVTSVAAMTGGRPATVTQTSTTGTAAPEWRDVPAPTPLVNGALNQVDAVNARLAWAVGIEQPSAGQVRTAIYRWDGGRWLRQRSPVAFLPTDVAASGPKRAWAVGAGAGAVHWDGAGWRKAPIPSGVGTANALAAAPDGSAWAVARNPLTQTSGVLRWVSGRWTKVKVPLPAGASLASVGAHSKDEVWVAGTAGGSSLVMRWNGRAWKKIALPPPIGGAKDSSGVVRVHPLSAGNVWALRGPKAAALLHWNGRGWTQRALPAGHFALSLAEDGRGGVWVVPYTDASTKIRRSYYLHWDGRAWRKVHGRDRDGNVQLGDIDRIPGTTSLFGVGTVQRDKSRIPFIERYH